MEASAPPAAGVEVARIESGVGNARRPGGRSRIQAPAVLRAGEGLDTDGARSALLLVFPGQRTATLGLDSALSEVQTGEREASAKADARSDLLALDHGEVTVDAPAGGRGFTVRVGATAFAGDDAAFTVRTTGGGARIAVARGTVRFVRGDRAPAAVLANQVATVAADGALTVEPMVAASTFVEGFAPGAVRSHGHRPGRGESLRRQRRRS